MLQYHWSCLCRRTKRSASLRHTKAHAELPSTLQQPDVWKEGIKFPQIQKFYTFPAEHRWHKVSVTALAAMHTCITTLFITLTACNNSTQSHLELLAALEKHLPSSLTEQPWVVPHAGRDRQTDRDPCYVLPPLHPLCQSSKCSYVHVSRHTWGTAAQRETLSTLSSYT